MTEPTGKLPSFPPAFTSKALETLLSQYGHPHQIVTELKDGEWTVKCSWANHQAYAVVGSREEADIVVETLRSDFMP